MMKWNQPICDTCWENNNPGRKPVVVTETKMETCAWCGKWTGVGIYVRAHPDSVKFPKENE